ncbi:MAG: ATP synthase F1 subunit gamma [Bdellovibrionales bacterium]|nr:ATP synthase F1 subunit gamma [Bdellovibrionales bacterium]
MPNLKDIRNRIQTTKNTQQITRAMKMVSAAKLRRAQLNIQNLRPFANQILSVIADIATTQRVEHPLLNAHPEDQKVLLVVLTSDRGLAGGFNNNINRFAYKFFQDNRSKYQQLDFLFVGRKGADFFRARNIAGKETILNLAREISFGMAEGVASRLMAEFAEGGYDSVFLVYNEFKSAISQEVVCERLLPVDISKARVSSDSKNGFAADLIFEPEPALIIDDMLKKHFAVQVYRAMCESVAAEHGARMAAMENATKNAGEMIRGMTLTYNKLRQASITTELIEITSGAEALKG